MSGRVYRNADGVGALLTEEEAAFYEELREKHPAEADIYLDCFMYLDACQVGGEWDTRAMIAEMDDWYQVSCG